MSIFSQRIFNSSNVRKKNRIYIKILKAKCSWFQTIPIIIRSKHSYWLLVLNFVTFLFGLTKILSWKLFVLTQKFKQIVEAKPSLYFATFLYQNLLVNILQTQLTVVKTQDKWCVCKMSEDEDDLSMCESKTRKIQWFHIKCMRIKKIPKGKWFWVKYKTKAITTKKRQLRQ